MFVMSPQRREHNNNNSLSLVHNNSISNSNAEELEAANGARRKRKKSRGQSGNKANSITIGLPMFGNGPAHQIESLHHQPTSGCFGQTANGERNRTNSMSSTGSSLSSGSNGHAGGGGGGVGSPARAFGVAFATPGGAAAFDLSASTSPAASSDGMHPPRRALLQERSRHDSGGSIFQRRIDYSSFNVLPKHKINSYHIKMEDECSIGNDETRIFILSSFASNKMSKVPCVVCGGFMAIYDRYPLVDGTFFLSPRQHTKACIKVKYEGKTHFLTAVCMGCLEGWAQPINCRFCLKAWTGGHLVLGTMYSYDIFAATPCCSERLKCNNCGQLVIHPEQRFSFFSDYSQIVSCPHCGVQESHFCKTLAVYIRREDAQRVAMQQHQQQQQLQHQQQQLQQQQLQQQHHMHLQQQQLAMAAGMRAHRVNSA